MVRTPHTSARNFGALALIVLLCSGAAACEHQSKSNKLIADKSSDGVKKASLQDANAVGTALVKTPQQAQQSPDPHEQFGQSQVPKPTPQPAPKITTTPKVGETLNLKPDAWKQKLTPLQYFVLRRDGTEPPGTGAYNALKDKKGTFVCAACNNPLYHTAQKYDSKSGWPSFWEEIEEGRVKHIVDTSHGMTRTELECGHCGGHLGHVFEDGPQPTGERHCINSVSLYFRPDTK